jgi:hypothetical protein
MEVRLDQVHGAVGVSAFISAIIHICNGTTIIQIGHITNYKGTFFVNT